MRLYGRAPERVELNILTDEDAEARWNLPVYETQYGVVADHYRKSLDIYVISIKPRRFASR